MSLCERLDGLSLLTLAWAGDVRVLVLHDVIRDFALRRLGPAQNKGGACRADRARPAATLPAGDQEMAGLVAAARDAGAGVPVGVPHLPS